MRRHLLLALGMLILCGCENASQSGSGFRLPEGDAQAGRAAVVKLQCTSCHVIDGMPEITQDVGQDMQIKIGGIRAEKATYGRLVTSIINPSHQVAQPLGSDVRTPGGESKMRNYKDVLTVQELIDLVAFLQPHYSEMPDF